ncbi:class Ib ribonucleoside-diphosphate reductase assembly flavoprotein NrdI [Lactobacillus sp. YT155]|uniref:class Ib ribonucleoside-diphosphate reductase assembly flavoprotein NrdI n=1 Tax=Lactobacillus sp. YT155 TaxID=3060955 RepID=UPI00265E767E|nr:class Ib ribonucleoside-diphosphate reductase assembly flavoprotein NrdI [Lactobacillus sp. YT155]MDO1605794.1 class Ib ribonucleoside-diphosphate reductase assembly flavoprotein NrdI [Lactobacillus sp. YT155]
MPNIAYYTVTGQTRRFIKKTGLEAYEINDADPFYEMGRPFILVVPSYDDDMMDPVIDFLGYKSNRKNIVGVVGSGNRNFNELFNHTGKDIAKGLNIPVLYEYEFNGTDRDVEEFKKVVNTIGIK